MRIDRAALKAVFRRYHEQNMPCDAGCQCGFVVTDPADIDPYTQLPRTSQCPRCKGRGFAPRQLDLFPETL